MLQSYGDGARKNYELCKNKRAAKEIQNPQFGNIIIR